jgi:N-methylhydantoinase B
MNIPTGGDPRHVLVLVGVVYVLYSLDPKLYLNSGITRICKCILPSGTMVNPEFPAAVGMRTLSCNRLHGLTFGAFAQAAPKRLMGAPASGGPIMNVNTTDIKSGRRIMAAINPMTGGSGGCADGDGNDGSGANQGFLKNTPTEVNEVEAGILVHRYGLMKNSAGPGKHRGGLGTEMVFEALAPNTKITARNRDRTRFAGWGIAGGKAGAASAFVRNPGKNNQINLGNTDIVTVDPGDVIYVSCGGAGGWGSPIERDPKAVLHDFKCGWVTLQHAKEIYGVVISEGRVDKKATAVCRNIKKSESIQTPSDSFYNVSNSQQEFEKVWTKQNYDTLTGGLSKLPISWRFFAKHQIFSAIEKMPDNDPSKLDGTAVQTEFNTLLKRFPDLRNLT